MLTIRREQLERFDQIRFKDFEERVLGPLRESLRDETRGMSDDELHERIGAGVSAAHQYGISEELDVVRFLHLAIGLGEPAWVSGILSDPRLDGEEKLDRVLERLIFT